MSTAEPSYTVFIRLPFPRGDFVDPPSVEWDATKDKALWKILSKASKNSDIDWNELSRNPLLPSSADLTAGRAVKFDVTLTFLLQQAAWLYERQLLQVRAQMRKVGVSKGSSAPSPVPGSESAGGEMMRRTGSSGTGPRITSAQSSRKDSPVPKADSSVSNTKGKPRAPAFSRNSSANNTTMSRNFTQASPRVGNAVFSRRSVSPRASPRPTPTEAAAPSPQPNPLSSPDSSSSELSSDSEQAAQSRQLRRPRFTQNKARLPGDDDDDELAFMPFAAAADALYDPSATLKGESRNEGRKGPAHRKSTDIAKQSQTSDSSASSTAPVPRRPDPSQPTERQRFAGPLSPKRTAELAGRSPGMKGKGREGSDGTPSMGSSFSDLDDASITQSALEEALASNMQAGGGMASRMSSISQALRSKYL